MAIFKSEKDAEKPSRNSGYELVAFERNIHPESLSRRIYPIIECFFTSDAERRRFTRHKRTFDELCLMTGFNKKTLSYWLGTLKKTGCIIERIQRGKRGNPKFYFLRLSSPGPCIELPLKPSNHKSQYYYTKRKNGTSFRSKITISKKGRDGKIGFPITSIDLEYEIRDHKTRFWKVRSSITKKNEER